MNDQERRWISHFNKNGGGPPCYVNSLCYSGTCGQCFFHQHRSDDRSDKECVFMVAAQAERLNNELTGEKIRELL